MLEDAFAARYTSVVRVFLQEALEHQLVIRSFGAQPAIGARADALREDHFDAQMRRRGYSIAANASFSFFFNALYVVALTWCALELVGSSMSYGTLMAVLQLVGRIQVPVSSLSGMMPQLYQTLASAERLMEVAGLPRPRTVWGFRQRSSTGALWACGCAAWCLRTATRAPFPPGERRTRARRPRIIRP